MQHSFELSYDPPRTTTRDEYKAASCYLRYVRRRIETGVQTSEFTNMLTDALLYGRGSVVVSN